MTYDEKRNGQHITIHARRAEEQRGQWIARAVIVLLWLAALVVIGYYAWW